jgi:hypothetical protein
LKTKLQQYRLLDLHISQRAWWFGVIYASNDSYETLLHASGFSYQGSTKVYRHQPGVVAIADFEADLEKSNGFFAGLSARGDCELG